MAVFKCKMCGGELDIKLGSTITDCPYCGTRQTVPFLDDDKKTRLYNRANGYRLDSEFDKAYGAYETIISEKPDEAEAYWGLVLSEYGVEYVEDSATKKRIPTCHRTLLKSVTSNENYKLALQYADTESRILYEDEAEELDKLQKRILNASAKEEPYDVFICYKETDANGERTPDSVLAQDIYNELTRSGLRVFFSRISLEEKLGSEYEPCIFAALMSAKVMLVVTTDSDNVNAVWVKNEWKRYIDFMKNDKEKTLIPVYRDISPYTLPDDFAKLQAQDMSKLGAIQDLVHAVEKLVGKKQEVQAALSDREKELLDSLEKSRKRTKLFIKIICIILAVAVAAGAVFGGIRLLKNTLYQKALGYIDVKEYQKAYDILVDLNYLDSDEQAKDVEYKIKKASFSSAKVGDIIAFGTYDMDGSAPDGKANITWKVIRKEGSRLLVISEHILIACGADLVDDRLNDFQKEVFNDRESVFLISRKDIVDHLSTEEERRALPIERLAASGENVFEYWIANGSGGKQVVSKYGIIFSDYSERSWRGVRPAMWIDISDVD